MGVLRHRVARRLAVWSVAAGTGAHAALLLVRGVPPLPAALYTAAGALTVAGVWRRYPERVAWSAGLANLALLVPSVVVACVLLEVGARVLLPPPGPDSDILMPHPKAVFTLAPGTSGTHHINAGDGNIIPVPLQISDQGWRGPHIGPKQPGEFRILLLGDSHALGHAVPYENTIGVQLEARLRAAQSDAKVTVINGGTGGTSPWQQRIFLREKGFPLEPDLVLHQLYPGNDIPESLWPLGKTVRCYNEEVLRIFLTNQMRQHAVYRAHIGLRKRSRAYQELTSHLPAMSIPSLAAQIRLIPPVPGVRVPASEAGAFFVETSLRNWYPELEQGFELMAEDVLETREACEARGIAYGAFVIPNSFVVNQTEFNALSGHVDDVAVYDPGKEVRVTEAFLAEHGIPYAPVLDVFATRPDIRTLYYNADGHCTPRGNALVAGILAPFVLKEFLGESARTSHD